MYNIGIMKTGIANFMHSRTVAVVAAFLACVLLAAWLHPDVRVHFGVVVFVFGVALGIFANSIQSGAESNQKLPAYARIILAFFIAIVVLYRQFDDSLTECSPGIVSPFMDSSCDFFEQIMILYLADTVVGLGMYMTVRGYYFKDEPINFVRLAGTAISAILATALLGIGAPFMHNAYSDTNLGDVIIGGVAIIVGVLYIRAIFASRTTGD